MRNFNLVEVFKDTFNHSIDMIDSPTTMHTNDEIKGPYLSETEHNIKVINCDTVSAITELVKLGKTCALNMASYKRPGGGVEGGARAQEECLFRCSNLIHNIPKSFYPLSDTTCLYTERAIFFKDVDYDYMEPVESDVITIAAFNLNNGYPKDYINETLDKIRLMLTVPYNKGVKNIILGAFGCGVFGNKPDVMSSLFKKVLIDEGYSSLYDNVVFAIINDHNSVGSNYEVFRNTFKRQ